MDIGRNSELRDRLAAEYALGTLRGRARERFRRWIAADAGVASAAAEWEARLAPMVATIEPVSPPARVWRRIRDRLAPGPEPPDGLWGSVVFWRSAGLAAAGMAAALLVAIGLIAPRAPEPIPAPVVLQVPSTEAPASYLAVLSDPKSLKPVLLVSAGRTSDLLWVKTLDPEIRVAGKSLQLWALPATGKPRSLGLVGGEEKTMLKLVAIADIALAEVPTIAASLEPAGGSPTDAPSGPVLFSGACVKYW